MMVYWLECEISGVRVGRMSGITDDPADPAINRGSPQHDKYLVLSEAERKKGFVRPYRASYIHTGRKPQFPLRDATEQERADYGKFGYVKYEEYPVGGPIAGRWWTEADLKGGCGVRTTMGQAIAETYARDPKFYGATFCCGCQKHIRVEDFQWEDGTVLGS